ncbi:flagellar protein FlaG [Accumulibacter sp.]|uniref:flagellar protein FlaG n=1 Tax=Accumulibacter sp. TaxID=2053492 RepID=UPI0025DDBC62|nr:flagellar protein FlaG [Accumulibacter sp.]MCM8612557.1 flagellar protein FlaG [Accumulibacter sp.]MCM8636181.1 flagellar protein FlaG [Accumulibacter sp.]MCM8639875.1 flagellar protein FlaG [Accumulibacter sp.]
MNIQPSGASLPTQAQPMLNLAERETRRAGERAGIGVDRARLPVEKLQATTREQLETATASVRSFVQPINRDIEFSVNDDTGQLVVKIIDRSTKEVIRQMPSAEMIAIAKTLDSIKGLFVKQSA